MSTPHRIALLAFALIVVFGYAPALDRTAATFSASATSTARIAMRPACIGDLSAYTSNLLPKDAALRWSFSGALPVDSTGHPLDASAPGLTTPARGLLECDPADLSTPAGTPGSLTLTPGPGSGLTANAPTTLGAAFTLLFWTSMAPGAAGELASLANPDGRALVVSVDPGGEALVTTPDPTPATAVSGRLADGEVHLVAVTFTPGAVELTVDGASPADAATAWTPGKAVLTVGAQPTGTSAGAVVDEVTLLTTADDVRSLTALVTADRWWSPGPLPTPTPTP